MRFIAFFVAAVATIGAVQATTTSTCPTVCTQACMQGYSCQPDANGCVACRPTPYAPFTDPLGCTVTCTINEGCTKHCTCPTVSTPGYQYDWCGCPSLTSGNGKCVYSSIETFAPVCTQSNVISELINDGACTVDTFTDPSSCVETCIIGQGCTKECQCPAVPGVSTPSPNGPHYEWCGCPSGKAGNGECVYSPGTTIQSVCNQSDSQSQLNQVCTCANPTPCKYACRYGYSCQVNPTTCVSSCQPNW